ncbi:uncharacterized protein [Bos taurus]|uniref:uncharacterized protein isoform X1 n=1 Tax=Bos taurus TaxID=9913 RepID=UPI000572C330|nr:uncharacterized protein LOC100847782 isoform X1 [Bos taurus]
MFTPDGSSHFQGRSLEREQRGVETSGWNTRLNWEDSNEEQFVHDLGKTKRAVFTVTNISYDVRGVAMQVPSRVSVLGIQSPHLVQPFWSLSYSQMTASNQG